ncbi:MAG: hypothetical protein ACJ76P_10665 [Actinomycetota bacterium]|jgi:hypothetical protein
MDEIGGPTEERSRYGMGGAFLVAAVLSAIPAFVVKIGLDKIIDGVSSGSAPRDARTGATFVAIGLFVAVFAILFAVFGVRDELVNRLRARREETTLT